MTVELISTEEIEALPDGPEGFLAFERLCRERLNDEHERLGDGGYLIAWREAYMSSVSAAAFEYGVDPSENLAVRHFTRQSNDDVDYDFGSFSREVRTLVVKLQIRKGRERKAGELTLPTDKQLLIKHHVELLRGKIGDSDLSIAKKKLLSKKLDELLTSLGAKKFDLARLMVIVAAISHAVDKTESAIIKLPDTIDAIARIVGEVQEYHDALLPPPVAPKQITDQSPSGGFSSRRTRESLPADLDDEIPF